MRTPPRRAPLAGPVVAGVLLGLGLMGCSGEIGASDPARPGRSVAFEPLVPLTRRLTTDEYRRTVADVLGVALGEDDLALLPEDLPLGGFVNTAQGQATSPDHVLAYDALAARVVERLDLAGFLDDHAPCTDPQLRCTRGFVESAGQRLFRRPLDPTATDAFVALFDAVLAEDEPFAEAAGAVVRAMLQSPQFLYLLDDELPAGARDEVATLDGYAIASRLSYYLWGSAPDEELLEAARRGRLETPDQIEAQADRLLADTNRARAATARFLFDWAGLGTLPNADGLRPELQATAVAFYQDHLWERDAPLFDLFTAQRAALTPALAEAYGVPVSGEGIQMVDLSGVPDRVGLLTQPGVIAGMTNADGGEIVARGLFQLRQLFCGEPPHPPDDLQSLIDEFVAELPPNTSDREVAEIRLERSECAYCHAAFDPVAYGFERFDYRGAYRLEDEHGNPMATDGWLPSTVSGTGQDEPYETLEELMTSLGQHPRVQQCFVRRQLEYALGTQLTSAQTGAVRDIANQLRASDGTYRDLARTVVRHALFRQQTREAEE